MINSPFDIYLGDPSDLEGYRTKSFVRDSAPQIAPRFSTGTAGQTDLDLLKSVSLNNLAGGMFQRLFTDSQKAARAVGLYNKYDENVYPAPAPITSGLTALTSNFRATVKAESELYTFVVLTSFSAGTYYNTLLKFDKTGGNTATVITLPSALSSNGFSNINDITIHKGNLYVSSYPVNNFRYNIAGGTWQDISGFGTFMRPMRGILYHITVSSYIYSVTNELAAGAATYTQLDIIGSSETADAPTGADEFNGALWVSKPSGLYRFDGVRATKVLSLSPTNLCVFNGALYFMAGGWLYRFDGVNVTRIQFFGTQETIGRNCLSANSDYLFILSYVNSSGYGTSDKDSNGAGMRRLYTYDGAAFMLYNETQLTGLTTDPALLLTYAAGRLYEFTATFAFSTWTPSYRVFNLASNFVTSAVSTGSQLDVTLSEFDDDFPNILKSLEMFDINYTGMIAGDSLTVKYQLYDGKSWGSWNLAATLNSNSSNQIEIINFSKKLFKRIKVNITLTAANGSAFAFKGASFRYTLQPRHRWRWQVTIAAYGSDMTDRNGEFMAAKANTLKNSIEASIRQKTPSFMLTPDYGVVKYDVSNSATTFVVDGELPLYTDPYGEYQLCAVGNTSYPWEILRVDTAVYSSITNETTVSVKERGYFGNVPAPFSAGSQFHIAHKVYINRLLRDAVILDEETYDQQPYTGESQLKREFSIELVEV